MQSMKKTPEFWNQQSLPAKILSPISLVYASAVANRVKQKGYKSKLPVICVGNLVAGGAGKTPTALYITHLLQSKGLKPHFLASGYSASLKIATKVIDEDASKYGDEAVLLSKTAPAWIGRDRAQTAQMAEAEKADALVLDDGFQNPSLEKTFSVIVVDGEYGFGNGRVIPAGPLRELPQEAAKRADAVIIIGEQTAKIGKFTLPTFSANVEISFPDFIRDENIVAFCGLARPEKFFNSLKKEGLKVIEEISFPDHHPYSESDLKAVLSIASQSAAVVVTTEKDYVKIPPKLRMMVQLVKMEIALDNEKEFSSLLFKKITKKSKKS